MFDKETYIKRRSIVRKNLNDGVVLLLGNDQSSRNFSDNHYPFRQDSTFLYYTGLKKPKMALIIDIDEGKEILFGIDPSIEDIIYTGPRPELKKLGESAGVDVCLPYNQINTWLSNNLKDRRVHFLPPYRPEHKLHLTRWLGISTEEIQRRKSVELINTIAKQRSVKNEEEIAYLEEALTITGKMHVQAMKMAKPGMKEYELMSHVHQKALEFNADLSFPIILTTNGQILHNHYYGNTLKEGYMVLCDAGAEHESGYAGDISRTFPVSNRFTDTQRSVYQIVWEAQQLVIDKLKPSVRFKDLHLAACLKIVEGLKGLGLMTGDAQDAVNEGAHSLFFQCGLGHMIGLDAHDMENLGEEYVGYTDTLKKSKEFGLKSLRLGKTLSPQYVVTVEPGIYFIPKLIDMWAEKGRCKDFINYSRLESFRNFGGVRIEDCFLITKDGNRLLGEPIPGTIKEIENQRQIYSD